VHPTDSERAGSVIWWKYQAEEGAVCAANSLQIDLEQTTVIYKMHGSIDRAQHRWITSDNRRRLHRFLTRMIGQTAVPAQFMATSARIASSLWICLNDWNLRVILNNLHAKKS